MTDIVALGDSEEAVSATEEGECLVVGLCDWEVGLRVYGVMSVVR